MPSTMSGWMQRARHHRLTISMWEETQHIVETVSQDPKYRVVVLTSALEKYFTVGLDRKFNVHSAGMVTHVQSKPLKAL